MSDEEPPEELVAKILAGDRQAEQRLVIRYGRTLKVLLRARLKDVMLADDVYQDTFFIVIQRLRDRGIDEPKKLANFINRTAINVYKGMIRKESNRETYADSETVYKASDQRDGPLEHCQKFELRLAVRKMLKELRLPRDRDVLWRFYVKEESKKSICTQLNLTPANFDRVISRARQRFRNQLMK